MLVVQMHGVPGSGKTTIARELSGRIGALVLDKDVIKTALMDAGMTFEDAGWPALVAHYEIADMLLRQGHSVILDNPVAWSSVQERSRGLAERHGARYVLIECVCTDSRTLARRLASRPALASQARAPLGRRPGTAEPVGERLILDTLRPLQDVVDEAVAYVSAGVHV
jgi:predicted kinase